jgi:hypothetical protein
MPTENDVSAKMMPSGPGAAAVVAAGIGSFALGSIAFAADKAPPLARLLILYRPTGPLSGVSTAAIAVWLAAWVLFHYRWSRRNVELCRIVTVSFVLLAIGLLLTFPPFADLL